MSYVIALDIGGTNLRSAIVDSDYNIIKVLIRDTVNGKLQLFYDDVVAIIRDLDFDQYQPVAISIGVPGRVRANGFIDALPNINIANIDLANVVSAAFGLPVFIRNDAEMASVAEAIVGAGRNFFSTYFITISTGIGGSLFENGIIKNASSEIGHTLVPYQGEYYELEKIASGNGLLKLLKLNHLPLESAKDFFAKIEAKDPQYLPIYHDWINLIADLIKFVQRAFSPSIIVLTGGVMKSADIFFDDLVTLCSPAKLVKTHFSQNSGLIGAAAYGFIRTR